MDTPSWTTAPCNARTRKQYVQGGASLPEPPLFTCSDPPTVRNIAHTCATQQARRECTLRQPRKHRHRIARSHAEDPRDTATASDTLATGHAMLRAAKRHTTRPPSQGPGGALRPLDPGSFSLACEPARRPRWAGRPDSSIRQSGGAARTSRSQSFSPISMLVMQRGN